MKEFSGEHEKVVILFPGSAARVEGVDSTCSEIRKQIFMGNYFGAEWHRECGHGLVLNDNGRG